MTQLETKIPVSIRKQGQNFGNAREVRNLFENMKLKLAVRVQNSNVDDSEGCSSNHVICVNEFQGSEECTFWKKGCE